MATHLRRGHSLKEDEVRDLIGGIQPALADASSLAHSWEWRGDPAKRARGEPLAGPRIEFRPGARKGRWSARVVNPRGKAEAYIELEFEDAVYLLNDIYRDWPTCEEELEIEDEAGRILMPALHDPDRLVRAYWLMPDEDRDHRVKMGAVTMMYKVTLRRPARPPT